MRNASPVLNPWLGMASVLLIMSTVFLVNVCPAPVDVDNTMIVDTP